MQKDGISIFDCDSTFCIEKQIFSDIPWGGVKELIHYALSVHYNNDQTALEESIKSKFEPKNEFPVGWLEEDNIDVRNAILLASIKKQGEWFKAIYHGEALGDIVFKYLDDMDGACRLRTNFCSLSSWIDK